MMIVLFKGLLKVKPLKTNKILMIERHVEYLVFICQNVIPTFYVEKLLRLQKKTKNIFIFQNKTHESVLLGRKALFLEFRLFMIFLK